MQQTIRPKSARRHGQCAARAVAFFDARAARIAGLTGDRDGIGVGPLAEDVAATFVAYGRRTLLVPATTFEFAAGDPGTGDHTQVPQVDLVATAESRGGILVARRPVSPPVPARSMRSLLTAALLQVDQIVVALPPTGGSSPLAPSSGAGIGAACDAVLMVCLTGVTTEPDLNERLRACRILGIPVCGLVLNDQQVPFGSLLSEDRT